MGDLIKALQILLKYRDEQFPVHCEHDVMYIVGIDPAEVSEEDKAALKSLGFISGKPHGEPCFYSYKYGSA